MSDYKEIWIRAKNDMIDEMMALGFSEELGILIAKNLGSPKAMERMTSYLINFKPKTEELIVDEMLSICSDIARWKDKKESEAANAAYNEYLNSDIRWEDEE